MLYGRILKVIDNVVLEGYFLNRNFSFLQRYYERNDDELPKKSRMKVLSWILIYVDGSFVEVKDENVDKWNSVVDASLLVLTELVDMLFRPILI